MTNHQTNHPTILMFVYTVTTFYTLKTTNSTRLFFFFYHILSCFVFCFVYLFLLIYLAHSCIFYFSRAFRSKSNKRSKMPLSYITEDVFCNIKAKTCIVMVSNLLLNCRRLYIYIYIFQCFFPVTTLRIDFILYN